MIPAICVSRVSTDIPLRCRVAANAPALVAAAVSKSRMRFSRSSSTSRRNSSTSARRFLPSGNRSRPNCSSKMVIDVVQTDSLGWRSSHRTTSGSATGLIRADTTFVSRMITDQTSLAAPPRAAAPVFSCRSRENAQRSESLNLAYFWKTFLLRAKYDVLRLPYFARAILPGAAIAPSRCLRDFGRQVVPRTNDITISFNVLSSLLCGCRPVGWLRSLTFTMTSATIKLFLPRGDAKSLRTAEISNWTGKAVAAPRTELEELLAREELDKAGVYILTGNDPLTNLPRVYIGEAEIIRSSQAA